MQINVLNGFNICLILLILSFGLVAEIALPNPSVHPSYSLSSSIPVNLCQWRELCFHSYSRASFPALLLSLAAGEFEVMKVSGFKRKEFLSYRCISELKYSHLVFISMIFLVGGTLCEEPFVWFLTQTFGFSCVKCCFRAIVQLCGAGFPLKGWTQNTNVCTGEQELNPLRTP